MLAILAGAKISLAGPDGRISQDQHAALLMELAILEQGHLNRLGYWGIEL